MRLRDRFWLWGHPEGIYNHDYGNTKASRMTPMEFCSCFGIKNTFMIPVKNIEVNRRQYNKSFMPLQQVGWECFRAGQDPELIEPLIRDAKDFSNISCVVFDDFKSKFNAGVITPLENLYKIRDRLHHNEVRKLDSWMVLYTFQFGNSTEDDAAFQPYMDVFDGIIMWTWEEKDVPLIPEKFELFKKYTPHNRRMFGCYLYNFGEQKQATGSAVKWQLDFYREKLLSGEAEGVVLHTNTMADLDYEAYDVAYEWMAKHGDEEI